MTILVIHHTLGVTRINIAPESIRKSYHYARATSAALPLRASGTTPAAWPPVRRSAPVPLDDQMQRRRAARAMAEGNRFSTPGRDGANALLRQPAEADLIHHRINGGINGGEGPGVSRRGYLRPDRQCAPAATAPARYPPAVRPARREGGRGGRRR